jgi:hypothetical protein
LGVRDGPDSLSAIIRTRCPSSTGFTVRHHRNTQFDGVVARIETCRGKELSSTKILSTWEKNAADEDTCKACDTRTFCPDYKGEGLPQLPGVRG